MSNQPNTVTLSQFEREAIVLQVVVETIEAMVNYEMLDFSPGLEQVTVTPRSSPHYAMFNVLLADMLEAVDSKLLGENGNLIEALVSVSNKPQLEGGEPADHLQVAVQELYDWLEREITVDVPFPSIDAKAPNFWLKRRDFVSICGNICKHNVSRLTRKAKRLASLLESNRILVDWVGALPALDDFQMRFHDDILAYHVTTITELLNNIRWAIHDYLLPEFERAYVPPASGDDLRYSFDYPAGLENPYARSRYWDLMNSVRRRPHVPRFTGTPYLKRRY